MSQAALTLHLPDDIYERVRRAAKGMNQPMEEALVNIVKAAMPSLEKVPVAYRAELEATLSSVIMLVTIRGMNHEPSRSHIASARRHLRTSPPRRQGDESTHGKRHW